MKLLGFYIGTNILGELMTNHLTATLEARLLKAKRRHYSLSMRVTIVNQLVIYANQFMLQLWMGKVEQLEMMDREVADFLWSGSEDNCRRRVDYAMITKAKEGGGLGLISFKNLTVAQVGKTI